MIGSVDSFLLMHTTSTTGTYLEYGIVCGSLVQISGMILMGIQSHLMWRFRARIWKLPGISHCQRTGGAELGPKTIELLWDLYVHKHIYGKWNLPHSTDSTS